jgi:hypothetical protein
MDKQAMDLFSRHNLYPGINAHLNSFLQETGGGWSGFHTHHLVHIFEAINLVLPKGYYAVLEQSLQITEDFASIEPQLRRRKPMPDITIVERYQAQGTQQVLSNAIPTLIFALEETSEEEYASAIVIYELMGQNYPGKPLTRLELLSNANKPPHKYHADYLSKRHQTLQSGIVLVEVDYLHQKRPIVWQVPSYIDLDSDSYPYYVLISLPQPTLQEGSGSVFGIEVTSPLPVIDIPLGTKNTISLAFQTIYNRTYEANRLYSEMVNYAEEPINMDRYHTDDQAKIRAVLQVIRLNPPQEA